MLEAFEKISLENMFIEKKLIDKAPIKFEVVLTFEERKKSRYKTQTICGTPLGWFLERGQVLADGDGLKCTDGTVVKISAAAESVSEVTSTDPLALTRAAYHLGNRHVPLQIGEGFLRYQHDHVLDEMVHGLGLKVTPQSQPFQPESGAYHKNALNSSEGHNHKGHNHEHTHNH